MTQFSDLVFNPHPNWLDGVQAKYTFPNGYTASVIRPSKSYGGRLGLYEMAILYGDGLVYDTPITDDVLGHLSEDDVTGYLQQIAALPPRREEGEGETS